jgi:hypothetical protein
MPALRHGSSVAESQSFGEFSFPRLYGVYLMICVAVLASSFAWCMLATQEKDLRQKRELEQWQGSVEGSCRRTRWPIASQGVSGSASDSGRE